MVGMDVGVLERIVCEVHLETFVASVWICIQ